MEKYSNRINYINNIDYFLDNIKITDKLIKKIKTHEFFVDYKTNLEKNNTNKNKNKYLILYELTKERSTCAAIIDILNECDQNVLADRLKEYNTSSGPNPLSLEVNLKVVKTRLPKLGLSNTYTLSQPSRGLCVIINNVEEPQTPDIYDPNGSGHVIFSPKGLRSETLRFENVFRQLLFNVDIKTKLSSKEMIEELISMSQQKINKTDEAFVLIVITHGQNNKLIGYNGCEALRKQSFGRVPEKDFIEVDVEIERDSIDIKELVQLFSKEKCPNLYCQTSKPKLFFFICCRNSTEKSKSFETNVDWREMKQDNCTNSSSSTNSTNSGKKMAKNLDTFISYSCADGCESIFSDEYGMSLFGLALTQSIAQYSCEESLLEIMSRTSDRLKGLSKEIKESENEMKRKGIIFNSKAIIGNFAIQVNNYAMDKQLFFNPGYSTKK